MLTTTRFRVIVKFILLDSSFLRDYLLRVFDLVNFKLNCQLKLLYYVRLHESFSTNAAIHDWIRPNLHTCQPVDPPTDQPARLSICLQSPVNPPAILLTCQPTNPSACQPSNLCNLNNLAVVL